jgi:hypothetical protein
MYVGSGLSAGFSLIVIRSLAVHVCFDLTTYNQIDPLA